jgi:hypothetical protein
MKLGIMLFRFGILGFLFAPGVFFEEPLKTYIAQNHGDLINMVLLYGLPVLAGFTLLAMTEEGFRSPHPIQSRLLYGISAVTCFWLALWTVLWFGMSAQSGNSMDLVVRYMGYLGFFGCLTGATAYYLAWKTPDPGLRACLFVGVVGWNFAVMSAINIHLQPTLHHLTGPGFGGLLAIMGIAFISRSLKYPTRG